MSSAEAEWMRTLPLYLNEEEEKIERLIDTMSAEELEANANLLGITVPDDPHKQGKAVAKIPPTF